MIIYVFSSQGTPDLSDASELHRRSARFRDAVARFDTEAVQRLGWSAAEAIREAGEGSRNRTRHAAFAQPVLTAFQIGVAAVLEEAGIRPQGVAGLSMGEVAALYVAGIYPLKDVVNVVAAQSEMAAGAESLGEMIIADPGAGIEQLISGLKIDVYPAVRLSPTAAVFSGNGSGIRRLVDELVRLGVRHGPVRLALPYHSPLVAPLEGRFRQALRPLQPRPVQRRPVQLAAYSSVTGTGVDSSSFDEGYWWRVVSEPAEFESMVRAMLEDGYRTFVEIGMRPMLLTFIREIATDRGIGVTTWSPRAADLLSSRRLRSFVDPILDEGGVNL